jgi:hypothetical protein
MTAAGGGGWREGRGAGREGAEGGRSGREGRGGDRVRAAGGRWGREGGGPRRDIGAAPPGRPTRRAAHPRWPHLRPGGSTRPTAPGV